MAYFDVASLRNDTDFLNRVAACYSVETLGDPERIDPGLWSTTYAWQMASAPGFGDAYGSAIAGDVPNPGKDPAVISDAQILSAVQYITNPPPGP